MGRRPHATPAITPYTTPLEKKANRATCAMPTMGTNITLSYRSRSASSTNAAPEIPAIPSNSSSGEAKQSKTYTSYTLTRMSSDAVNSSEPSAEKQRLRIGIAWPSSFWCSFSCCRQ